MEIKKIDGKLYKCFEIKNIETEISAHKKLKELRAAQEKALIEAKKL